MKPAEGFVVLPGGFGTLDELSEALTLIQTGKVEMFPLVLFDSAYWAGIVGWLRGLGSPGGDDLGRPTSISSASPTIPARRARS